MLRTVQRVTGGLGQQPWIVRRAAELRLAPAARCFHASALCARHRWENESNHSKADVDRSALMQSMAKRWSASGLSPSSSPEKSESVVPAPTPRVQSSNIKTTKWSRVTPPSNSEPNTSPENLDRFREFTERVIADPSIIKEQEVIVYLKRVSKYTKWPVIAPLVAHIQAMNVPLTTEVFLLLVRLAERNQTEKEILFLLPHTLKWSNREKADMTACATPYLNTITNAKFLVEATESLQLLISHGYRDSSHFNILLRGYFRQRNVAQMERLWQCMRDNEMEPNADTYALMISGYHYAEDPTQALLLLKEMKEANIALTPRVCEALCFVCATPKTMPPNVREETVLAAMACMEEIKAVPTLHTYRSIIQAYEMLHDFISCEFYYWEMTQKFSGHDDPRGTLNNLLISFSKSLKTLHPLSTARPMPLPPKEVVLNESMLEDPRVIDLLHILKSVDIFVNNPQIPPAARDGKRFKATLTDAELTALFGGHPCATPPAYLERMRNSQTFEDPFVEERAVVAAGHLLPMGRSPAPGLYFYRLMSQTERTELHCNRAVQIMEYMITKDMRLELFVLSGLLEMVSKSSSISNIEKVLAAMAANNYKVSNDGQNRVALAYILNKRSTLDGIVESVLNSVKDGWVPWTDTYDRLIMQLIRRGKLYDAVKIVEFATAQGAKINDNNIVDLYRRISKVNLSE